MYRADLVKKITIKNQMGFDNIPDGASVYSWDISEAGDESVLAGFIVPANGDEYALQIITNGGKIALPANANEMFAGYTNCTSIEVL